MKKPINSILYPFAIDSGLGRLAQETDYGAHVEQLIKQVLFTSPGERINRPDFGCGLRRMVFAPNSDVTASLTRITVFQALENWLGSLISIDDVKVSATNEILEVTIVYVLKARLERRHLNLEVTL
jgi:phage baseplate assembly protein W